MGCTQTLPNCCTGRILVPHSTKSELITSIERKIPELKKYQTGLYGDYPIQQGSCQHLYLNKWEGKYVCMDCFVELQEPACFGCFSRNDADANRIQSEIKKEANTPADKIPADMSVGKLSQMRGVTIGFLLAFTAKFNCWDKSSWWIIRNIVKPMRKLDDVALWSWTGWPSMLVLRRPSSRTPSRVHGAI